MFACLCVNRKCQIVVIIHKKFSIRNKCLSFDQTRRNFCESGGECNVTEQNIFLGEYCTISPREVQWGLIKISLKETIKKESRFDNWKCSSNSIYIADVSNLVF